MIVEFKKQELAIDTIEIETNGSLIDDFLQLNFLQFNFSREIVQLNISPKFIEYPEKYKNFVESINKLQIYEYRYFIKLVYQPKYTDIMIHYRDLLYDSKFIITPMTPPYDTENFLEVYRQSCIDAVEFCLKYGFQYSPREHVFLFGQNRNEFKSLS
jgi:hypothetical protein